MTDPSGALLVRANVTARNLDTGLVVTTSTTGAGLYSIPNLPPGRYSVTVAAPDLKKYVREGVTVQTGSTVPLDIQMQLGAVTENVVVNANASQLETVTSDIGATVEKTLIENLPLEVSGTIRNPVQFITLIPGFVGSVGNNPGDNSTDDFKVNGGQENSTDVLVDGVSISLVSPNTQWNKGVSTEAVQEFKVLQSNFSPEYGESGDGIVSLTLKSGTNDFHGSVYDFLRNRALDANSWTNDTAGLHKSVNTQNDFGATIGGPVRLPHIYNGRDKTFFFFDYEGFRFRTGGTSLLSVPNEAFRKGDLSALLPAVQLYDPTTHAAIPGDILTNDPNFKPSAVMSKVFALLPPTNGSLTNNVVNTSISTTTADLYDVKIDQVISSKQRISGGLDWDDTDTGGVSNLGPIFGSHTPQVTRYARVSDDYIFSDSVVNHLLFGFSRRFRTEASNTLGQDYPAKIGLTGVSPVTFPCIKFVGTPYESLLNNCGDSQFADNVYQVNESVTWAKGKHVFKFGGENRNLQFNVRRLTQASGEFDFMSAETSAPNGTGGNPVASALFGLSNTSILNYGAYSGIRYKNFSFYGQDSYKLTPKLVVNYGLRYDVDIPASEAFDRFSAVDPTLPNPGAGNILGAYTYFGSGTGRNGRKRPQDIYTKAIGPRLGFAYSINDKTVLRGGYGIFYEPLKEGSYADQDSLGFFNRQTITPTNGGPTQIDNGVTRVFPNSGPFTPDGQNGSNGVIMVPANTGRPSDVQSWNLDVQRQITANLLVSVAYVGTKGTHLVALNVIPNQVNPSYLALGSDLTMNVTCLSNGTCPRAIAAGIKLPYPTFTGLINQAIRPFPQYGDFNQEDNSFSPDRTGNSTYHAMQLGLDKRIAQGLSFLVSYTVSKNITDADSSGPGVSGFTGTNEFIGQNSYDRKAEKAVSELDTPQSLVASLFYELPVGHGKTYMNKGGPVNTVVGGWFFSTVASYHSGTPTEVYGPCGGTAGDVLFAGCHFTGAARVNVIPGVQETNKSSFHPFSTSFWNAAAFSVPAPLTFGNEPRSLASARFYAPKNEDFTLGKKTLLFEDKLTVDFRAEFFDIFNRHIYLPSVGGPNLATPFVPVGGPGCPGPFACGFGAVTNASGPRTIQFGLNISY
ncbi:carboxypeptidase regulatory-like domain-containing protein [Edaphobacter paludis]|uniref:TonB-dependent receptor n=1 Tax=Edaphobacter paludis TaxID=3035702 RepID=UPI0035A0BFCD